VGETGGNRLQIAHPHNPQKQAKTVATRWDRLPKAAHGKEAQTGTRGIDRCGAVLTDDAGPISAAFPRRTHQLLTNVAGRVAQPRLQRGT
jgi:hypothetical protein